MSDVFLDTVGLLAIWNRRDQWHATASQVFAELMNRNRDFVTTPAVLLECGNAAARQPFRSLVGALRQKLFQADRLIEPTADEGDAAWLGYLAGECGDAGIVDHLSFAVMRRLQIF